MEASLKRKRKAAKPERPTKKKEKSQHESTEQSTGSKKKAKSSQRKKKEEDSSSSSSEDESDTTSSSESTSETTSSSENEASSSSSEDEGINIKMGRKHRRNSNGNATGEENDEGKEATDSQEGGDDTGGLVIKRPTSQYNFVKDKKAFDSFEPTPVQGYGAPKRSHPANNR